MTITIIIPMFNAEKTIQIMLDSIQQQTHQDFTVLLIDDGSTDQTAKRCLPYVEHDSRFSYHHKDNGGVSSARNYGLEKVTGPYVCFLDSDDYIEHNFLELMLRPFLKDNSIDFTACSFDRNGIPHYIKQQTVLNTFVISNLLDEDGPMGYMCNKLFRSSIIQDHQIRFEEEVHYGEDFLFCINYLLRIQYAHYVSDILFHYVVHEGSKSSNLRDPDTLTHITALDKIIEQLKTYQVDRAIIEKYLNVYYRISLGYLFRHNLRLNQQDIVKFENILNEIDYSIVQSNFLRLKITAGKLYVLVHKFIKDIF